MVTSDKLNANVATSLALYTYIARSIDLCQDRFLTFWLLTLNRIILSATPHIDAALSKIELGDDDQYITIGPDGQVSGINDIISTALAVENQNIFKEDA